MAYFWAQLLGAWEFHTHRLIGNKEVILITQNQLYFS